MNLFLAVVWLLGAVVLFAYEHFVGDARFRIRWGGANFSAAWLMLVLGLYNVARWWSNRAYRADQRSLFLARAHREQEIRRQSQEPSGPPDPNFQFTDQPPPAPDRRLTDQPPSNN